MSEGLYHISHRHHQILTLSMEIPSKGGNPGSHQYLVKHLASKVLINAYTVEDKGGKKQIEAIAEPSKQWRTAETKSAH